MHAISGCLRAGGRALDQGASALHHQSAPDAVGVHASFTSTPPLAHGLTLQLVRLMEGMKAELQAGTFVPVTAFTAEHCTREQQSTSAQQTVGTWRQPHSEL